MYPDIWNSEIETMSADELNRYETPLLIKQLARVYHQSPYYREKFDSANLKPESINSIEKLADLPFTEKSDLVKEQSNGALFGSHQCAPFSDIVRVVGTGGSSGTPTRLGWTRNDIESYNEMGARALWAMGCRPDDMVINCFNYSIYAGGIMDHGSFEHLGAGILPYSVGQSERLLSLLAELPKNDIGYALYSTPSYAIRLAKLAMDQNLDLRQLGFKKGFFSGEPGLQVTDYRDKIEQAWGMLAMDLYGAAEVGVQSGECEHKNGMHYCGGGHVAVELIDSDSGEVKKMREGETGELVFTTLLREACPMIRLRTHDTVRVYTEPCDCGRRSFRFHVLGRNDDMFIVKGVNIFPLSVQETLLSFRPRVTGEFFITLDHEPPIDYSPKVCVELADDVQMHEHESLINELKLSIQQRSNFTPNINFVAQGSIVSQHKTKRLYRAYAGVHPPIIQHLNES